MKRKILLIVILGIIISIFLISYRALKINQKVIVLQTFANIPAEIDGFSCYIFNSTEEKEKKEYLGVGDSSYIFFLNINGDETKFTKTSNELVAGKYSLEINQQSSGVKGNEYYDISGTIHITNMNTNTSLVKNFIGYCSW